MQAKRYQVGQMGVAGTACRRSKLHFVVFDRGAEINRWHALAGFRGYDAAAHAHDMADDLNGVDPVPPVLRAV